MVSVVNQRDKIIIILAVAAIIGSAIWAMSPYGQAQDTGLAASPAGTPSPAVGPTAYAPGANGGAAPTIIVGTRTVSTPSPTPVTPSPTPAATPAPTAMVATGQQDTSAQLVNYGTDKDTFNRGEQATGFITIKNTGSTVINDVTTSVSASRELPVAGTATIGSKDYTFSGLNINPGETKRVEFKADIPAEYKGVSTAGEYTLQVNVKTAGKEIGSFSKDVTIA